jgi:hypothetical protein
VRFIVRLQLRVHGLRPPCTVARKRRDAPAFDYSMILSTHRLQVPLNPAASLFFVSRSLNDPVSHVGPASHAALLCRALSRHSLLSQALVLLMSRALMSLVFVSRSLVDPVSHVGPVSHTALLCRALSRHSLLSQALVLLSRHALSCRYLVSLSRIALYSSCIALLRAALSHAPPFITSSRNSYLHRRRPTPRLFFSINSAVRYMTPRRPYSKPTERAGQQNLEAQ